MSGYSPKLFFTDATCPIFNLEIYIFLTLLQLRNTVVPSLTMQLKHADVCGSTMTEHNKYFNN